MTSSLLLRFDLPDLVLFCLYVLGVLFVGFRASRGRGRSEGEFLLAGRTLTLPIFVATLVSTWYGGILGVGEYSYRYGLSNWIVFGVPYYVFALVFALVLAKRIRSSAHATIPDRLAHVFDRRTALLGGALTFLLSTPAAYVLMLGVLVQLITGWSLSFSLVMATFVTVVYLWRGGFRSDVWVNVLEFVLMFVGFGTMIVFAYVQHGGWTFIAANVPPLHLTWHGGNTWQFMLVWFFIALWTLVDPAFHQRCAAAKDAKTAQRGIIVSILFWVVFDFLTTASGLYARALLPDLAEPMYSYPLLAQASLPVIAKGLFFIGLLATIMSTLSSLMLISGITIGKDLYGRWVGEGADEAHVRRWTQFGLILASALSIALALIVPSVVGLWYTIGTCVIPGLLIPVLAAYVEPLHIPARYAFGAMLSGWSVATASFLTGVIQRSSSGPEYWFGLEPMIPGLCVAAAVWGAGKISEVYFARVIR